MKSQFPLVIKKKKKKLRNDNFWGGGGRGVELNRKIINIGKLQSRINKNVGKFSK